jgi:hypothetical protein
MSLIHIKSLSGDIQTLEFSDKCITIDRIKSSLKIRGYSVTLFTEEKDEDKNDDDKYIDDGTVLNVLYEKEQFTKEETEKFENILKDKVKFFSVFKEAIIQHKAIIAGGSVLSVFGDYPINDLDIYIHYSNSKEFLKILYINGGDFEKIHNAPAYDQSFFKKNNIISRFHMKFRENFYRNLRHLNNRSIKMDIMIIPDHIPLENIVTNFDLTFCQVWWDGKNIYSDDIEDVRTKSGSLNKDYIPAYLDMNQFIVERISKYTKRGFKINISLDEVVNKCIEKQKKSINDNEERWAVTKIVEQLFDIYETNPNIPYQGMLKRYYKFFDIHPIILTRKSLEEKIGTRLMNAVVTIYYLNNYPFLPKEYKNVFYNVFHDLSPDILDPHTSNTHKRYHNKTIIKEEIMLLYNKNQYQYNELTKLRQDIRLQFNQNGRTDS